MCKITEPKQKNDRIKRDYKKYMFEENGVLMVHL